MEMASSGQPVAQTAQPKHLSRVYYRYIVFPQGKGFGGASVNTGLACCAQISVKPGLKTRIESQTGLGLFKGILNCNAIPAVAISDKSHAFFHVLAHVDKTGLLCPIQDAHGFFLA